MGTLKIMTLPLVLALPGLILFTLSLPGCDGNGEGHEGMHEEGHEAMHQEGMSGQGMREGMHEGHAEAMDPSGKETTPESASGGKGEESNVDLSDYPLDVCVVSGEELGSMGPPVAIEHDGRRVVFCCKGCVSQFKENPEKYLAKLDAAEKEAGDK